MCFSMPKFGRRYFWAADRTCLIENVCSIVGSNKQTTHDPLWRLRRKNVRLERIQTISRFTTDAEGEESIVYSCNRPSLNAHVRSSRGGKRLRERRRHFLTKTSHCRSKKKTFWHAAIFSCFWCSVHFCARRFERRRGKRENKEKISKWKMKTPIFYGERERRKISPLNFCPSSWSTAISAR